jgi:hypothetical protein
MTKEELLNKLEPMVDMYMALDGSGRGVRKYFRSQNWYEDINIYTLMINALFHMVRLRLKINSILSDVDRKDLINSHLEKALLSKKLDEALISMGISNE